MTQMSRLAREIASLKAQLRASATAPQLPRSSIEDGVIEATQSLPTEEVDAYGNVVYHSQVMSTYGMQPDGSSTVRHIDGPRPPRPVAPLVTPGPGYLSIEWTGEFEDAYEPYLDHDYVAVHVADTAGFTPSAATQVATFRSAAGEQVVVNVAAGTWFVSLVAVALSGRWSVPAPYSDGEPGEATGVDVVARQMAQDAADAAVAAETAAQAADRVAREGRALADAVSAAANRAATQAIDAARTGAVTLVAANGLNAITYSPDPPDTAPGRAGDTWFRVDPTGQIIGYWECTDGDGDHAVTPATPVTPAAVVYTPTVGSTQGTYTIPAVTGVDYLIDRVVISPGEYQDREGAVAVTAKARDGFVIPAGERSAWVGTIDPGDTEVLTPVTPAAPTFTDLDGADNDEVTLPAQTGVVWFVNAAVTAPGTHPATGSVTVNAAADDGYVIDNGSTTEWTYVFDPLYYVTPAAPTFTDLDGADNDEVTIPSQTGVTYRVGGQLKTAGTHAASGTTTVTAHPATGYALDGTATWTYTYDPYRHVTPTAPTFNDTTDTFTITAQTGVTWQRDGTPIGPGVYTVPVNPAVATTTFTGIANGQPWPAPWARSWGTGAGCVADVQTTQGRMVVAGRGAWEDKMAVLMDADRADFDITYTVRVNSTNGESWHHLLWRCPQTDSEPRDGFDLLFLRDSYKLFRVNNWASTTLGTWTGIGMALDTNYKVRVRVEGPWMRTKMWLASGSEPGSWQLDVNDTQFTNGRLGFHAVGSSSTLANTHLVDDIVVTDPTATGDPVLVAVTAHAATGYVLEGTTSWTHTFS